MTLKSKAFISAGVAGQNSTDTTELPAAYRAVIPATSGDTPQKKFSGNKKTRSARPVVQTPPHHDDMEESLVEDRSADYLQEEQEEHEALQNHPLPEAQTETRDEARRPKACTDPTTLYLNEIGYAPLLTAEQEVQIARNVLKGDASSKSR